jgi:putative transposase
MKSANRRMLRPNRRSIRLKGYDYSQPGAYFVTLVARQRECLFGEISDGEARLSEVGKVVWDVWQALPARYAEIDLDEAVVMPNHFHGIIWIKEVGVGAIHELPQPETPQPETPQPETPIREEPFEMRRLLRRQMLLPKVIGYFKMNSAKRINALRDTPGEPVWQRNYYERVIRNEGELEAIREYIRANPLIWEDDQEYVPAKDSPQPG